MTDLALSPHGFSTDPDETDLSRRRFLTTATIAVGVAGAAIAAVPFVESWLPSERARSLGSAVDVDLAKIEAGAMIVVLWRRQPVFIVHRTPEELGVLQLTSHLEQLRDPQSDVHQQPDYTRNWHRSVTPEYLVVVGICTHLGCIPRLQLAPDASLGPTWKGGYLCPCHGSRYDLSARVFKGVPAPYNLPVPPHRFLDNARLRIGENPAGSDFDFDSIVQV